jgi:hypothetical protein
MRFTDFGTHCTIKCDLVVRDPFPSTSDASLYVTEGHLFLLLGKGNILMRPEVSARIPTRFILTFLA